MELSLIDQNFKAFSMPDIDHLISGYKIFIKPSFQRSNSNMPNEPAFFSHMVFRNELIQDIQLQRSIHGKQLSS